MSLLDKIGHVLRSSPGRADPPILNSPFGFSVSGVVVTWPEILEIRANKLDLLTTDEVRFVFALTSGQVVEVSEEQHGFSQLVEALAVEFPDTRQWEAKVIPPAFAPNPTVLYCRT